MYEITLEEINESVHRDPDGFIKQCESAYFDSLVSVGDQINQTDGRKLVLLAGPSSSGKTTTAKIIKRLIDESGRDSIMISLDDFYLDQTNAPKFEDGTPDFETVYALDIHRITHCLRSLFECGEATLPIFDFETKKPKKEGRVVKAGKNDVIIVEGLHALNPVITNPLEDENLLKLYVSVSSRIFDGDDVFFTKRDIRFIRRMIRDYQFRNCPVDFTFYLWKGVRTGEDRYLFPFRNRADVKIDSVHPYEMCVYKDTAMKLLEQIGPDSPFCETANEYILKLGEIYGISRDKVPEKSLLREFLG